MTTLFGRRASLILGTQLYEGMRLSFEVMKTAKPEPNTLELEVSNLNRQTRAAVQKGTRVILNAGYQGTLATLFIGQVRRVVTKREGPTILTKLTCGDGDTAYAGAAATVGLAKGTTLDQAVLKMAGAMGVDGASAAARLRQADVSAQVRSFPRGYSASGKASTELQKLVERAGLSWSFQDGQLQVLGPREVLPGQAVLLREDTGLLESPEPNDAKEHKGPPTTTLKSLLQPSIRPGTALQVEAEFVKGLFRAETVKHTGDTHGEEWLTTVEALAL